MDKVKKGKRRVSLHLPCGTVIKTTLHKQRIKMLVSVTHINPLVPDVH